MFTTNPFYQELSENYLFSEIARKVEACRRAEPEAHIIRLGIGDVTLPLAPAVIAALHRAVDEMATAATFRGYGPEQGYDFLREAIREHDYRRRGINVATDEIFVSDGSKCDVANIQELFGGDCRIAICDPVYPVYRDSNLMAGRGAKLQYLPCVEANGFLPEPPRTPVDVVYLCSPNNPTGAVFSREQLAEWVEYARRVGALLLFDSAYEAYIRDPALPRSIYEIPGAEEVAVEFRSFSKTAGFTGLRCAYCVVPRALPGRLNALWRRRQTTKFNGVSYPVQRAAEAVYSEAGRKQIVGQIDYYLENARKIRSGLLAAGMTVFGGEHSPYVWWKLPVPGSSMAFFDRLLHECHVVGTPGSGFGTCGEGYFRLTGFGSREATREAVQRIATRYLQ